MSNQQIARTNQSGQVARQSDAPTFTDLVAQNKKKMRDIAASNVDLSRLYRLILSQIRQSKYLQNCRADSVMLAMQQSAEVGLEPGTALQLAYLVPYKDECQFIIGYRGYIELFRRSGYGVSVDADVVYEGDEFMVEKGLTQQLRHVPKFGKRTPDKVLYAYAVARFKDGSAQFEVLTREDLEATKKRSAAGDKGPWSTDFAAMCKKTAIRRLAKLLPMAINVQKAMTIEERNEAVYEAEFMPVADDDATETPFDDFTTDAEEPKAIAPSPSSQQTVAAMTN